MSEKETEEAVAPNTEAETPATSPVHEKRNSTSSPRRPSLYSEKSSPLPEVAPVLGVGGFVSESSEKAQEAASAFKQHSSPSPTRHNDVYQAEKESRIITEAGESPENNASVENAAVARPEAEGDNGDSNDEEDEIVYPGGVQLALLTFGLCMATFTIALDNTIIGRFSTRLLR